MANRNVDKGREAENAVAAVLRAHGMLHAERRAKRGGTVELTCSECRGVDAICYLCDGIGTVLVPADAGDLTGVPGVVVQVKWSGYKPLTEDMRRTDEQRRVAGADVGLLVRKRKGVGVTRAGEWDAYLPTGAVWRLLAATSGQPIVSIENDGPPGIWHTDLANVARLLSAAGYGSAVSA